MKIMREFREFAMRGSVVDLAVGVMIGAAFGKIVASLVADILMPPIALLLGNVDFTNLFFVLRPGPAGGNLTTLADAKAAGAVTWNYGVFLNVLLEFLIVAFAIFLMVKQVNRLKRKAPAPPPPNTHPCPECLSDIPNGARRCAHCGVVVSRP